MRSYPSTDLASFVVHCQRIFSLYLGKPYPGEKGCKRVTHGITHGVRVSLFIHVFASLYSKYSNNLNFTAHEIFYLKIIALLHDSGRLADGKDIWDLSSAINAFYYLRIDCRLPIEEAKIYAEAIANKDYNPNDIQAKYMELLIDKEGKVSFFESQNRPLKKHIYAELLHDADCLDIIRARPVFDVSYLHFFQKNIIGNQERGYKDEIFSDLSALIREAMALIYRQQDDLDQRLNPRHISHKNREYFTQSDSYLKTLRVITENASSYPVLINFNVISEVYRHQWIKVPRALTQIVDHYNNSKLYFRAVNYPGCKLASEDKTKLQYELRKIFRRPGIRTRRGSENKDGSLNRSVTLLGPGVSTYGPVGFGFFSSAKDLAPKKVSENNATTGHGTRSEYKGIVDSLESANKLGELITRLALGGRKITQYKDKNGSISRISSHNEIIVSKIKHYDCIIHSVYAPYHSDAVGGLHHFLESIYLHFTYKKNISDLRQAYPGVYENIDAELPIYIYDARSGKLEKERITKDRIMDIWTAAIDHYVKVQFNLFNAFSTTKKISTKIVALLEAVMGSDSASLHLEIIKTELFYKVIEFEPLDAYYPTEWREQIASICKSKVEDALKKYSTSYMKIFINHAEESKELSQSVIDRLKNMFSSYDIATLNGSSRPDFFIESPTPWLPAEFDLGDPTLPLTP